MTKKYPGDILLYFRSQPSKFRIKIKTPLKILYILLSIVYIVVIINPGIITGGHGHEWLIRIIAALLLISTGLLSLYGTTTYYNKQSGGIIIGPKIKRFDLSDNPEDNIIEMFNNNDFKSLFALPSAEESILQLSVFEDEEGQELYCQLRKFFPETNYRGISEVKTIRQPQYNDIRRYVNTIRQA